MKNSGRFPALAYPALLLGAAIQFLSTAPIIVAAVTDNKCHDFRYAGVDHLTIFAFCALLFQLTLVLLYGHITSIRKKIGIWRHPLSPRQFAAVWTGISLAIFIIPVSVTHLLPEKESALFRSYAEYLQPGDDVAAYQSGKNTAYVRFQEDSMKHSPADAIQVHQQY